MSNKDSDMYKVGDLVRCITTYEHGVFNGTPYLKLNGVYKITGTPSPISVRISGGDMPEVENWDYDASRFVLCTLKDIRAEKLKQLSE